MAHLGNRREHSQDAKTQEDRDGEGECEMDEVQLRERRIRRGGIQIRYGTANNPNDERSPQVKRYPPEPAESMRLPKLMSFGGSRGISLLFWHNCYAIPSDMLSVV